MEHLMSEAEEREHVIAVARTWLGTPFHDQQCLKGVGVDCAHLLQGVWVEAGLVEPFKIEPYSPQFMLHSGDERFIGYVEKFAHEIPEDEAQMGDIVLYKIGRSYAHGAIIVEWPARIIHAFKSYRAVAETDGYDADLLERDVKFYSFW
jgi:NlpC/P60 family putative phage cell wall peptidase